MFFCPATYRVLRLTPGAWACATASAGHHRAEKINELARASGRYPTRVVGTRRRGNAIIWSMLSVGSQGIIEREIHN